MTPRRVIKLGGSLLSIPDWETRFREWYRLQPPAINFVVVGGGKLVNQLRALDEQLGLGELACHEIAIGMMSVNAHLVSRRLGLKLVVAPDPTTADPSTTTSGHVVDVTSLEQSGMLRNRFQKQLPRTWKTTSDSLAAALATFIGATELVLLKITDPPPRSQWRSQRYVDSGFENALTETTSVRAVNLNLGVCRAERP